MPTPIRAYNIFHLQKSDEFQFPNVNEMFLLDTLDFTFYGLHINREDVTYE